MVSGGSMLSIDSVLHLHSVLSLRATSHASNHWFNRLADINDTAHRDLVLVETRHDRVEK
jgi:hypothetical protein